MANQPIDDPAVRPANTATDSPSPRSSSGAEKQGAQGPRPAKKASAFKSLGWLDRFLALWILLAMVLGVLLGNFVPEVGPALQKGKFADVSIPIAVGLLVMMYPILCKVQYEILHRIFSHRGAWKQIGFSVFVNWIVAPFFMLALAWAFLPDKSELRVGLILVGLGRCIAMVLIWTSLAGGDTEYCAILVAVNSILQMVLFAPLAILFIRVISRESGTLDVSYSVVATSVGVFLGIPFGAALITRFAVRAIAGHEWFNNVFLKYLAPWSLIGLLYTIVVLFASQGRQVVHQIVSVIRVAAPFEFRNNFELAIAVAVATYGPQSDQALAATVGPLIEVPVLIFLVYVVKWIGNRLRWQD
ncbi:sodium bile acid symporter family-domain-containing protein [Corynascus similis CBS 632.67]